MINCVDLIQSLKPVMNYLSMRSLILMRDGVLFIATTLFTEISISATQLNLKNLKYFSHTRTRAMMAKASRLLLLTKLPNNSTFNSTDY
jgi:hypothetical protein